MLKSLSKLFFLYPIKRKLNINHINMSAAIKKITYLFKIMFDILTQGSKELGSINMRGSDPSSG